MCSTRVVALHGVSVGGGVAASSATSGRVAEATPASAGISLACLAASAAAFFKLPRYCSKAASKSSFTEFTWAYASCFSIVGRSVVLHRSLTRVELEVHFVKLKLVDEVTS